MAIFIFSKGGAFLFFWFNIFLGVIFGEVAGIVVQFLFRANFGIDSYETVIQRPLNEKTVSLLQPASVLIGQSINNSFLVEKHILDLFTTFFLFLFPKKNLCYFFMFRGPRGFRTVLRSNC